MELFSNLSISSISSTTCRPIKVIIKKLFKTDDVNNMDPYNLPASHSIILFDGQHFGFLITFIFDFPVLYLKTSPY